MKVSNQPLGDFGRKGVLAFFFSETDSPLQLTSQFPHREEKSRKAVKQKQHLRLIPSYWRARTIGQKSKGDGPHISPYSTGSDSNREQLTLTPGVAPVWRRKSRLKEVLRSSASNGATFRSLLART